jgi:peptidylprolyl isomerase
MAEVEEGFVDISEDKDGGLLKQLLVEGSGEASPPAGSSVDVHYVGTLHADGSKFDSSRDRPGKFTFDVGVGQVIKGWDQGILTMKRGEKCILRCRSDYAYGEDGSPPQIPGGATLNFEVELFSWKEKVKTPEEMTADERVAHALKMKEFGTEAFKMQDYATASHRYADGVEYITFDGPHDAFDHEKIEMSDDAKQLAVALLNNCAMARMKLGEAEEAIDACNGVLQYDEKNVKALFRRAECELKMRNYAAASASCEKTLELEPGNKAAEALKSKVAHEANAEKKKEKAIYSKMFG